MDRVPVLLFGMEFWRKVINFDALAEAGTIGPADPELFSVVDTAEEGWEIVRTFYDLPALVPADPEA
jgi:predicted Rossmann-fold nucleotide-binding protein